MAVNLSPPTQRTYPREVEGADPVAMSGPHSLAGPAPGQAFLAAPMRTPLITESLHVQEPSLPEPHSEREHDGSEVQQQHMSNTDQHEHSFFQHYFTKPILAARDTEKQDHRTRKFSFTSLGSLVVGSIMLLVLVGVIALAVATSIHHHKALSDYRNRNTPIRVAIPSNFPDPALLFDNGTWYAFGTNNAAGVLPFLANHSSLAAEQIAPGWGKANIQMATSKNFLAWSVAPVADQPLPNTGEWTQRKVDGKWIQPKISNTWAPAVIRTDDGKYVMYYASAQGGLNPYTKTNGYDTSHPAPHCIGVAVSDMDSPAGPYTPVNEEWVCPWRDGGAIDPEVIRDADGTLYLVYKVDGNNIGSGGECGNSYGHIRSTPIMLQKLGSNGIQLIDEPVEILTNDELGDGPLVEAPMLVRSQEGIYFLFFSSGCTRAPSYDTKYATATSITGPYTRQNNILLKTGYWGLEAPGSISIIEDGDGGWNMAFQARTDYGDVGRVRAMFTTKLLFSGNHVTVVTDNTTVCLGETS